MEEQHNRTDNRQTQQNQKPRRRRPRNSENGTKDSKQQQGQNQANGNGRSQKASKPKNNDSQKTDKQKSSRRRSGRSQGGSHSNASNNPELKIIPLGGLDGIGKNMTAFVCGSDMIIVDAGIMFPDDDHLGVDLILPDYTFVLENAEKLRGIIITHGHEDHTGALPYLIKDLGMKVPIFGTKMTLGLIEGKFKEHKVSPSTLTEFKPGQTINLGCFTVSCFAVNHSIPGAVGLFMRTPAGTVLHTGDFKLDQTPIDGVTTDFAALSHYGHLGVDLMLSDSTNANNPNFTKSEAEVGKALHSIIKNADRRVIVASFSSHIHRLQQVCDAAIAAGRKVAVTGRSMLTNTQIARDLGYLKVPDDAIIDAYEIKDVPSEKLVILCTGSQGEPLSALARMANGEHRTVEIEKGDTVIISATPVPGNEKAVTRVINGLCKIGAIIFDKSTSLVHVSGHAGAEELKIVLAMVKPHYFMPVHGEAAHLRAHVKLAQATGIDPSHIFLEDNGDTLIMRDHKVSRGEPVESGVIYVDGLSVGDTSQIVLRDRQLLANDGIATVVVMFDSKRNKPIGDVELIMKGVSGGDEKTLLDDAHACVLKALDKACGKHGASSTNAIQKEVREALSKLLWDKCHRRPMIIPIIMDV